MSEIIPGAEPGSWAGGPVGVLVLHGFTGNPHSVRPLAEGLAAAGYTVEMPLLPGHGRTIEDMLPTRWPDWLAAAEAAFTELASRVDKVVVAGLSMGGSLTCTLALNHPGEIAGIICVNPATRAPEGGREFVEALMADGMEVMDAIGSDIADPDQTETAYPGTPLRPLLSLFDAATGISGRLSEIECPLLLFTSPEDHVVSPADSDFLAESVSGSVERVTCERSYHVATLDYDRQLIIDRSIEFIAKVTA